MATDPVAPAMLTLDRSDGSTTMDLYRAALGPVHTDYYLKAFTRFDAAGKSGPDWNWAAALLTLNWMVFRRLWLPALAYAGAVSAAVLLLFGIGRLLFQLQEGSQWALGGLALLLACVVPGAWGNAWLYAAVNRQVEASLASVASMEEAMAQLKRKTGGRKRQGLIAAGNLALLATVAGLVLSWPSTTALPLQTSKMEQAKLAPAELLPSGLAAHNAAGLPAAPSSAPQAQGSAAPAPSAMPASAPLPAASSASSVTSPVTIASNKPSSAPAQAAVSIEAVTPAMATRTSQGRVQAAPIANTASATSGIASVTTPSPATAPKPMEPASASTAAAAKSAASTPPLAKVAPALETKPSQAELRAKALQERKEKLALAREAKQAQAAARAASTTAPASTSAATPVASSPSQAGGPYLINVGLFADANNARNAYTKLKDAGLPALSQELTSTKGKVRTRVRAGPFDSQAEADSAAERIRALHLDAAVFKP